MFAHVDDDKYFEEELERYQNGYMYYRYDVKKIKLRSRYVIMNKGRLNPN